MSQFVHLHVHSRYSVLDGAAPISELFAKASADGQIALALTDHGNMFGVKEFLKVAKNYPDVKPIIGCEVYVNPEGRFVKRGKEDQGANHLILLAKNMTGYHNLVKLVSYGYVEGMYYKPKIDHELLEKYHEGIIACSACLAGEVPRHILQDDVKKAEEVLLWYKNLFGDDYYLELQRHESHEETADRSVYPLQMQVGNVIVELARKHDVKLIATNDVHFVNATDAEAHDRLICLNTNSDIDDPRRLRYTKQEFLKTQEEMARIFSDLPEALVNTLEIAGKIEKYAIDSHAIMPDFPLPEGFANEDDYLHHLAYKGAEKRYKELTTEVKERLDFELETVKKMGFPGYFLIVQDFIAKAREMGVSVGPGRGSAAGSVVAYCLGITDIDPIKYSLLFERFLNPDRISMPDIDIDFDDDGRGKVLNYVEEKYGKDHVARVVTFGTMAARSAIRDVARIQKLPLADSDRLAKLVPARLPEKNGKAQDVTLVNCLKYVPELQEAADSKNPVLRDTMEYAQKLEGSVRSTGVHACAIIIGRNNLMEHIPISTAKDKDTGEEMWVSQYEGSCIEEVGMLKMDFLGLKTLSILRDAVENIKLSKGIAIDINNIPIDDTKTYALFSRGESVGTFQFESDGMRKWLRELKPSRFEDLIAMNALYRPGPMDYIPDFISRKHGRQEIVYDLPEMEEYLNDTYGVTVYQEQVMLLSQKLANFTKGQADTLRKAMGKKQRTVLDKMKDDFIKGAKENGHDEKVCQKIWTDWEAFAQYAFNKSHSTCYAWIGYQTAYLKANYPAEYMAAVLSRNLDNIDEITKFMDECKRMGIQVLSPNVNESHQKFTVNAQGNIRFGMAAIKGVGANAVDLIVEERTNNGPFTSIFNFVERINLSAANRKTIEALALSGAFDDFPEIKRHQFFALNSKDELFIDNLLRYGNKVQADRVMNANSLFGGGNAIEVSKPEIPAAPEWSVTELLKKEKELIGMYLSAHPLDTFKFEMKHFTTHSLSEVPELVAEAAKSDALRNKSIAFGGIVVNAQHKVSQKSGKPWGTLTLEDYSGSHQFTFFGKDYETFLKYLHAGQALLIRAGFQQRFQAENKETAPWELKVKTISLLSMAREELVHSLQITLPINEINNSFTDTLAAQAKDNRGKVDLCVKIVDTEENMAVELFSRPFRIALNPAFLQFMEEENLHYVIS